MSNELSFEVKQQSGVITANFDELKAQLKGKMSEYDDYSFSEDTKKYAKSDVAMLRKLKTSIDDRRKEIKNKHMEPYNEFEKGVKELLGIVDTPISTISTQLNEYEQKRIEQKRASINLLYESLIGDIRQYLPLEAVYDKKWDNATTSPGAIEKELSGLIAKTESEVSTIKSMHSDIEERVLGEYKRHRSLAESISAINRHNAMKAEILARQEEQQRAEEERKHQAEIERIRQEERERVAAEQRIEKEAISKLKEVDEEKASEISLPDSKRVIYTVVGNEEELGQVEMALNSIGVYFERKDV